MTMTAHEIAKKAARMARRGFEVGIMMDMSRYNVDILVADEDGTRGLSVCAAISGFPILADGRRQVTLPEDEAAWTAPSCPSRTRRTRTMSETVSPTSEDQRLFDMIFQAAVEAT